MNPDNPSVKSPRVRLYEASVDTLYKFMNNLYKIETWDDKMTYIAAQLNIIGLICGSLQIQDGKIIVTGMLKSRVLIDCVNSHHSQLRFVQAQDRAKTSL